MPAPPRYRLPERQERTEESCWRRRMTPRDENRRGRGSYPASSRFIASAYQLRQVVQIARTVRELVGRRGRCFPRRCVEVKEFIRHAGLSSVARREGGQVETLFNQLQHGRIVHDRVRYKVLLGKRRNHNQR